MVPALLEENQKKQEVAHVAVLFVLVVEVDVEVEVDVGVDVEVEVEVDVELVESVGRKQVVAHVVHCLVGYSFAVDLENAQALASCHSFFETFSFLTFPRLLHLQVFYK